MLSRLIVSIIFLAALNGRSATPGLIRSRQGWSDFSSTQQKLLAPFLSAAAGGLTDAQLKLAAAELQKAEKSGDVHLSAALNFALCQAYFAREQTDLALTAAIRGREAARQSKDALLAALAGFGLARIHLRTGSFTDGEQAAMAALQDAARARYRSLEIRNVLAAIQSYLQKTSDSELQFRLALREAVERRDLRAQAAIHELYGLNLLRWDRAEEGHAAILKSWQIRENSFQKELPFSYRSLARSEFARGHFRESIEWADKALASPTPGLSRNWIHYFKALALRQLDREPEALVEVRRAAENTRHMRLFFPLGDTIQMGLERNVQSIFSLHADIAANLALQGQAPDLVRESFEAAQENRAWSLRARAASGSEWRRSLPPAYWRKLNELRRLELQSGSERVAVLHAELAELETVAGLGASSRPETRSGFRNLAPGELLIAFHFGEHVMRWDVSKSSLRITRLGNAADLLALAARFQEDPEDQRRSIDLASALFGRVLEEPNLQSLIIVPDEKLFQVPFAALRTTHASGSYYLAERYQLRLVPSTNFIGGRGPYREHGILAIGDPISNRADTRWRGRSSWLPGSPQVLELPRLAGSRKEIERCARVWPEPRTLLTGAEITIEEVRQKLQTKPLVLHFATHVYQPADPNLSPVLTLGLTPSAEAAVLNPASIAALPEVPPIVTLSGCGSGRGPLAPGTGLLGLTRAWLMAGSNAVVASLWPVIDDSGDFFVEYYRELLKNKQDPTSRSVAQAIHNAQVKMIQAGGWRASPRYWAAYFVIGAL